MSTHQTSGGRSKSRLFLATILCFATCLTPLVGCSSHKTTTTTVQHDPYDGAAESSTTTTTSDSTPKESGGLFSIIGDVIALPFRAVGAFLSAIF